MNAKVEQQIAEMKKQTIGVEVEMNNITRKEAAMLAATFFGTGRYEDTARRNGYYTWSAWDAQGREWKFQRDVSIAGPDDEKCEMVTPILTWDDIETLQELCRQLRHKGAKSDATRGCGVHIHIGANGHTPQTLRNLANIMQAIKTFLRQPSTSTLRESTATAEQSTAYSFRESTKRNRRPCPPWLTFGTTHRMQATAETNTTTTADTTCSTFTQPLPRARLNSDSSSLMHPRKTVREAFTQDSSRATFNFALPFPKWQKR